MTKRVSSACCHRCLVHIHSGCGGGGPVTEGSDGGGGDSNVVSSHIHLEKSRIAVVDAFDVATFTQTNQVVDNVVVSIKDTIFQNPQPKTPAMRICTLAQAEPQSRGITSFSSCLSCSLFTTVVSKPCLIWSRPCFAAQAIRFSEGTNSPSAVRFFFGAPLPLSFAICRPSNLSSSSSFHVTRSKRANSFWMSSTVALLRG